jgi:aryl-alcohol dehydrogenase-like predicted oxidoreductase
VDTVALAAVLAQPWADVVLSGAVTASQLASNVRATELALGPEVLDLVAPEPAPEYWAERSRLPWR